MPTVRSSVTETLFASGRAGPVSRRAFLAWGGAVLSTTILATTKGLSAATAITANRASTSRASREEAIQQLPLQHLKEPLRSRIQQVTADPTIYRRLPIEVIPCDPELYIFLVRYPEVVVNMWQLMGVTNAVIRRTDAYSYDALDGAGTVSKVELVYGTRDLHLFLAEGYYEGPLAPRRITGRCVLLLTSGYSQDAQDKSLVSNRLDIFLQLDKVGVELVAKTLHPLIGRTVDTNFTESTRFVGQVSQVAESNGPGVQRLVAQLTQIQPQVRTQFAQITSSLNQRAVLRQLKPSEPDPGTSSQRLSDASAAHPTR